MRYGQVARLCDAVDAVSRWAAAVAAVSAAAIVILMMSEILARFLLGYGLKHTWELSGYLMGVIFFLGAGYTLQRRLHVRTSAVAEILSPRALRLVDGLCFGIGAAILSYTTYALADLAWTSFARNVKSWSGVGLSLWIPQAALALGALLFALQCVAELLRLATGQSVERARPTIIDEGL
jgi:TRAP-type mannitol/chloroaromatic compound transport system permease small subunit